MGTKKAPKQATQGNAAPQASANPAADVARAVLQRYGDQVADVALCLLTPAPKRVSIRKIKVSPVIRKFLDVYEPLVNASGLYSQQAEVLKALEAGAFPNIVMTTATSSGKSLAFWAWTLDALVRDSDATAIVCFPTQALLWGQVERLRRISRKLCHHGDAAKPEDNPAYAGELALGKWSLPWTVWYGTTDNPHMKDHEGCPACQKARVRLTTVDKVHWSLLRTKNADFLRGLRAVVIDEAHVWHGLAGANVRGLINRIRLSCDVLGMAHPAFFLASATLQNAPAFASDLTGCPSQSFLPIDDRGSPKVRTVDAASVPKELEETAEEGLRRYVLLLKPDPAPVSATEIIGDEAIIGRNTNALCFVQSKFVGRRMNYALKKKTPKRELIVYDADMTAEERRQVERTFLADDVRGQTVIATSALEVGVDLPCLDVAILDELPPRRSDLVQRLGRVGRRIDRPGLGILCLVYSLADAQLLANPDAALSLEGTKQLPLPLHLERINLTMMKASFQEWSPLQQPQVAWSDFNEAIKCYFSEALDRFFNGRCPTIQELNQTIKEKLGDVIDLGESWYYKGFCASASQGKRRLVLRGTNTGVAMVDDIAVFRDAHPLGVYLGHRGECYRVVGYQGDFRVGVWTNPNSTVVLGKLMKTLKAIEVVPEPASVATRGRWKDRFDLEHPQDLPAGAATPNQGPLDYGVWNFHRKFDGYRQVDLSGRQKAIDVPLAEVTRRFKEALAADQEFPFLHDFSYRTPGWQWNIARVLPDPSRRNELGPALEGLLRAFLCSGVECATCDLTVLLAPESGHLRVIDSTPGGNGLSEALLLDGRASSALAALARTVKEYAKQPAKFKSLLADECSMELAVDVKEVADAVQRLARAWPG